MNPRDEGTVEGLDETEGYDPEETVTFTDDDGKEHTCVVLAVVEYEGQDYAMLGEADQMDSEDGESVEVYLFEYKVDDDGTEHFGYIEDEDRYKAVQEFCANLMDQDDDEDES